jgi:DsbC/DsbD-like thiol-disulfide interchange protein
VGVTHALAAVMLAAAVQASQGPLPFDPTTPQRMTVAARLDRQQPSGRTTLVIDATPHPGIHVYAPGNPSYIPVSAHVDETAGVRPGQATFPKGQTLVFGELKEIVEVYSRPFTIRQPLLAKAGERPPATVRGYVRYQACDDRVCFPPANAPFTATVEAPSTAPRTGGAAPKTSG